MNKRGNKSIGLFEIILMIFSSFAIAFILQENLVSGVPPETIPYIYGSSDPASKAAAEQYFNPPITQVPAQISAGAGAAPAPPAAPAAPPADPAAGGGPLEGLKAGVGKVFSGEATLGLKAGSTAAGFVGTLIGALAWAGVAYAVVQIIGSLLGVDKSALDAASYAAV